MSCSESEFVSKICKFAWLLPKLADWLILFIIAGTSTPAWLILNSTKYLVPLIP
jgi:hypothetical protein